MFKQYPKSVLAEYLRSFIFGTLDSLSSTVGLLSGIVIAGVSKETILLTGVILIFVEAFSMSVGDFLSGYSAESYIKQSDVPSQRSIIAAIIMFFSYFFSGFIPLFPYIILPFKFAFWVSIILSLFILFFLGVISAKFSNTNILRSGLRMFLIGGVSIFVGIFVGVFFSNR